MPSKQLLGLLCARADRPWNKARQGKPINGHWLAGRLSSIGIKPSTMRIGPRLAKGYEVSDFTEAFSRLLRDEPSGANGDTPSH